MTSRYPLRSRQNAIRFQDMTFIPGANNGYTKGRLIDPGVNINRYYSEQNDIDKQDEEEEYDETEEELEDFVLTDDDEDEYVRVLGPEDLTDDDSDDEDYCTEESDEESDDDTELITKMTKINI